MRTSASTPLLLLSCLALIGCTKDGPDEVGDDSTSSEDADTSDSGDGDTSDDDTGPGDCDPWQLICDHTGGMQAAMDCGIVTPNDDVAAWQAAHQCAIDAVAATSAFKVMGQSYGIDSLLSDAYGAIEGIVYGPVWLSHDSLGPYAEIRNCMAIFAEPNCSVEVGNLCLGCIEPSEETLLCE